MITTHRGHSVSANAVLQREIQHFLIRPVGRPPHQPIVLYDSSADRSASWSTPRRVVARVEWHAGELFPRVGLFVTNLRLDQEHVVQFQNGRGTAEQRIKEGKAAVPRLLFRTILDRIHRLKPAKVTS